MRGCGSETPDGGDEARHAAAVSRHSMDRSGAARQPDARGRRARRLTWLVLLGGVAACQARGGARGARRGDSLDLAQLLPRQAADSTRHTPPVIAEPSVVLFWLRAADTLTAADQAEAFDDLKYYTEQVAPALGASGIQLLATNADTVYVALPNKQRRSILLAGLDYPYGYLLIDPGGPERILTGVYADDELMDELRAYFDLPEDTTTTQPRITT